jgi:propanediol utilization protein
MIDLQGRFKIDRSANHVHLSEEDALLFFGNGAKKENITAKPLTIAGEFATNLRLLDTKGVSYTVLYPWRKYSQLELAQSDYYKHFKEYSSRVSSGELENSNLLYLSCPRLDTNTTIKGKYIPVITVKAHVHITDKKDIKLLHKISFPFLLEVKISKSTDGFSHIHLDTDQYASIQ